MIKKTIKELNLEILKWWQHLPISFKGSLPTLIHELNTEAKILFVGLNPARRDYKLIESISDVEMKGIMKKESVVIFGEGKDRIGQYKTYYGWLSNIADELKTPYEHYDLYHMSNSLSAEVLKEILEANSKENLKKEHIIHLSIFNHVLEIVNPKVIITNNINTANILKAHLNLEFDNKTGIYKNGNDKFYFLNGIMSYGRQTYYDKERLIWLVKKYYE